MVEGDPTILAYQLSAEREALPHGVCKSPGEAVTGTVKVLCLSPANHWDYLIDRVIRLLAGKNYQNSKAGTGKMGSFFC